MLVLVLFSLDCSIAVVVVVLTVFHETTRSNIVFPSFDACSDCDAFPARRTQNSWSCFLLRPMLDQQYRLPCDSRDCHVSFDCKKCCLHSAKQSKFWNEPWLRPDSTNQDRGREKLPPQQSHILRNRVQRHTFFNVCRAFVFLQHCILL